MIDILQSVAILLLAASSLSMAITLRNVLQITRMQQHMIRLLMAVL
jgi:hypothetical protein